MAHADVVIVGAGSAGLSAALRAQELGLEAVVFEAANRPGGRAYTRFEPFGFPWDAGCHWLHSASENLLREQADREGFTYARSRGPGYTWFDGALLSPEAEAEVDEGTPYQLALASSDPGDDSLVSWEINWGDGVVETVAGGTPSVQHTYFAGGVSYAITATATDEDGTYGSNTQQVLVKADNTAPVPQSQTVFVDEDGFIDITLGASDVDGDVLTYTLEAGPDRGTLSAIDPVTHVVRFTPTANTRGNDSFTFRVNDGQASAVGTITLKVRPINDAPTGNTATFGTEEDMAVSGQVTGNDLETPANALVFALGSGPANGTLLFNADGTFTYTPDANFNGSDSFTFTVTDTGDDELDCGCPLEPSGFVADGPDTSAAVTVTINVSAVNDAPTALADGPFSATAGVPLDIPAAQGVLGNDSDVEGDELSAVLVSGPLHGSLELNGDGSFRYTAANGYVGTDSFSYRASDGTVQSDPVVVSLEVEAGLLVITEFSPEASGFSLRFNRPVDANLLNLYDGLDGGYGTADITLTGAVGGAVKGSLVVHGDGQGLTFIKTGGVLAADTYTVGVRAGAGGLADLLGRALDGNADGIGGDSATRSFTVTAGTAPVLSLPDLVRGPGQSAVLPLTLTNAAGATELHFDLLLEGTDLDLGSVQFASGFAGTLNTTAIAGGVHVDAVFTSPLGAGSQSPLSLSVDVDAGATYRRPGHVKWGDITLKRGALGSVETVTGDEAVQVSAYFMDTSGNRGYSMLDVQRLQRVVSGLDTGYAAYPNVDPVLIGDLNGNGQLTSLDVNRFMQFVQGQARPEIPALPAGSSPLTFGGPARNVGLGGSGSASAGDLVSIPLTLDNAQGIESLTAKIVYDTSRLEYKGVRLATDFPYRLVKHVAGEIVLDLARLTALGSGLSELLEIDFQVKAGAAEGGAAIDLQVLTLNDGKLSQSPASQAGVDGTDAQITVVALEPPAPVMLRSTTASVETTNLVLPVPGAETNGGGAPQVNWSVPLAQTEPTPPNPTTVTTGDDWKKTAWAKDLTQRLAQIGASEPAAKSGLLKNLSRLLGKF